MACYQNLLGIFPNFFDFKLHCGSLYLTGWHPNGFKQGFNSWSIPHVLLKHTINILTDSAKRKVRMSSANLCDIQRNLPPNRYRTARCRLMVELIDSLSGNFTAPHRIYRASCRAPPLTFYICFVYKGANNGMKLSETKGQHNGREWERDTAPAVPPTEGRTERAKPQKGADFNQFF